MDVGCGSFEAALKGRDLPKFRPCVRGDSADPMFQTGGARTSVSRCVDL